MATIKQKTPERQKKKSMPGKKQKPPERQNNHRVGRRGPAIYDYAMGGLFD